MARKSAAAWEKNRLYCRKYYAEHKEECKQMGKNWRKRPENVGKVLEWRRKDWKKRYARQAEVELARIAKWKTANKSHISMSGTINTIIEKLAFIEAYGSQCACCGDSTFEFLTLDHINGKGKQLRKNGCKFGVYLYRKLRLLGYPKGEHRLLCMNCNFAFGKYGYCPHQFEKYAEYGMSAC